METKAERQARIEAHVRALLRANPATKAKLETIETLEATGQLGPEETLDALAERVDVEPRWKPRERKTPDTRRPDYEYNRERVIFALGRACTYCGRKEGATVMARKPRGLWGARPPAKELRLCIKLTPEGELMWPFPKGTGLMRGLAQAIDEGLEPEGAYLVCRACLGKDAYKRTVSQMLKKHNSSK